MLCPRFKIALAGLFFWGELVLPAAGSRAQGGPSVWKIQVPPDSEPVALHQDDQFIDISVRNAAIPQGIRARVFRGRKSVLMHGGDRLAGPDHCWLFYTCFLTPIPGDRRTIVRLPARLNDDRWLCANKNKLEDGYFVLVFEKDEGTTIFKISPESVADYFEKGVEIRVIAPKAGDTQERVSLVQAASVEDQAVMEARRRYEAQKNCVVLEDRGDTPSAALLPCGVDALLSRIAPPLAAWAALGR